MTKKIARPKGQAVARAILDMDWQWSSRFGDIGLNDLNYSDLFCRMWLDDEAYFAKTALYEFMPGVSRRTAVRYVQALIDGGWLVETSSTEDRRIKHVSLATSISERLEQFLAYVHQRFSALDK
ncbi:MarR family transcriptional regulator [Paraburkholderia sp.]|uniref:MarR family transcriptional regulator n=1 Tax=Paraburkholderia sp. TaxID=1926495 RepID=UPI00239EC521|nr:MarR family transcriptional regulator [Paraburkholderia sp.]MDE1182656.1 MarR family transcriptional regulator [Paraburkholderia sp.]